MRDVATRPSGAATSSGRALAVGWCVAVAAAVGARAWNAFAGPLMWGYDAWGHVAYVLFLDLYRGVPWADQGWSYFHPPLHYALGWVLAQFGSGDVLARGLSVLGGAASLGTAALSARVVAVGMPGRRGMPLLAFVAVAFLPVHLFMSPMPGNELTLTFLTAAAVGVFTVNECSERPSLVRDALCGGLVGLALLTKFSGLLPLLAILAALALRAFLSDGRGRALGRAAGRGSLIAGIALVVAFPYYARNLREFGTPFELSRGYPLIAQVEGDQPPGRRTLSHYFRVSPRMFSQPNPLAPHLLNSVWGTVYLNVWADVFRESDVERALEAERGDRSATTAMALIGLLPTALAIFGAALAVRDVSRGRRRAIHLPMGMLAVATVALFAVFSWRVPIWSALKASYLLGLSLPYAWFLARAAESLAGKTARGWRVLTPAAVGVAAAAGALVSLEGVVLDRRADAPATGALHFYFGETEAASRVYGRLIAGASYKAAWLDNLAAVNLLDGRSDRARSLYARSVASGLPDPYRRGRLAVALAVDGDPSAARAELDAALEERRLPELLANRGAIAGALGDLTAAAADLGEAVALAPEMVPAWRNLAVVEARRGQPAAAAAAARRAADQACRAPRGYPYGLGTGEVLEWGVGRRWLLLLGDGGLALAVPAWYRGMCADLGAEAGHR